MNDKERYQIQLLYELRRGREMMNQLAFMSIVILLEMVIFCGIASYFQIRYFNNTNNSVGGAIHTNTEEK